MKLAFKAGSASDPKGKEGLAALTASMISEAGSKEMRIDEIKQGPLSRWPAASTTRSTRR